MCIITRGGGQKSPDVRFEQNSLYGSVATQQQNRLFRCFVVMDQNNEFCIINRTGLEVYHSGIALVFICSSIAGHC